MENLRKLLINGSLVRAQQAEPIKQELSGVSDAPLVLNLEPGSKLRSFDRSKDHLSHMPWTGKLLRSIRQIKTSQGGIYHV